MERLTDGVDMGLFGKKNEDSRRPEQKADQTHVAASVREVVTISGSGSASKELGVNAGDGRDLPVARRDGKFSGQSVDAGIVREANVVFGPDGAPRAVTYLDDAAAETTILAALTGDGHWVQLRLGGEDGPELEVLDRSLQPVAVPETANTTGNGLLAISWGHPDHLQATVVVGNTKIVFGHEDSGKSTIVFTETGQAERSLNSAKSNAEHGRPLPGAMDPIQLELQRYPADEGRGMPIFSEITMPDGGSKRSAQTPHGAAECLRRKDGTVEAVAGQRRGGQWFTYIPPTEAGDVWGSFTAGKNKPVDVSALLRTTAKGSAEWVVQATGDSFAKRLDMISNDGLKVSILTRPDGKRDIVVREPGGAEGLNIDFAPSGTVAVHSWHAGRPGAYEEGTPVILRA